MLGEACGTNIPSIHGRVATDVDGPPRKGSRSVLPPTHGYATRFRPDRAYAFRVCTCGAFCALGFSPYHSHYDCLMCVGPPVELLRTRHGAHTHILDLAMGDKGACICGSLAFLRATRLRKAASE